jgi:hypothetical protein
MHETFNPLQYERDDHVNKAQTKAMLHPELPKIYLENKDDTEFCMGNVWINFFVARTDPILYYKLCGHIKDLASYAGIKNPMEGYMLPMILL